MTKTQEAMDSHIESIKDELEELKIELIKLDGMRSWRGYDGRMRWIDERTDHLMNLLELLTDR